MIYLDNAATSWPKPEEVYAAVDRWQREVGAAAGRGGHTAAAESERLVTAARTAVAELLHAEDARRIVLGFNGTDVLNAAIFGLLGEQSPGDRRVVTSVAEHNSVLRPLRRLERTGRAHLVLVKADDEGLVDAEEFVDAVHGGAAAAVLTHASNVTGAIQPVEPVAAACRAAGVPLIVDAAQTAGHIPIDVQALGVDLLATSGHKGLLGPLGTGVLYLAPGVEQRLAPFRCGGTGSRSDRLDQPDELPDKYESGNLNVPGLAGLGAGVRWLLAQGPALRRHEVALTTRFHDGLADISGVRLLGPMRAEQKVGVASIQVDGLAPQDVASILDGSFGVAVRAGLHCAPRMHQSLDTAKAGGTVRFSFGPLTTDADVDAALAALGELAG